MELKTKRLHPDAQLPQYATVGSACFDLVSLDAALVREGMPATVRTGLAFEVPPGFAMLIFSRSGHGFKQNTRLANSVGVIDSDYRGEVMVKLTADAFGSLEVKPGDRVAQAMLVQVPLVHLVEVEDLGSTDRGAGGFGSTGN